MKVTKSFHQKKNLKATEKKAKTGVWEKTAIGSSTRGVRVENISHEGASSSTNYEAIWRSSFFNMKLYLQVSRFTTSGLDVRILLNENVSERIHIVIFELIYGFVPQVRI